MNKAEFRNIAKTKRDNFVSNLNEQQLISLEEKAIERLADLIPQNSKIGVYWSFHSEFPTHQIIAALHSQGCEVAIPEVDGNNMVFRKWAPDSVGEVVEPDLLLVPLLGFDLNCNRIGYGKGYFDKAIKYLREHRTILAIGLAYDIQESIELPVEPHDQALDIILTETRTIIK